MEGMLSRLRFADPRPPLRTRAARAMRDTAGPASVALLLIVLVMTP